MGKTLSIVLGALAIILGAVLLISWWYEFKFFLRATFPIILIIGGIIALLAGISELKDTIKSKNK